MTFRISNLDTSTEHFIVINWRTANKQACCKHYSGIDCRNTVYILLHPYGLQGHRHTAMSSSWNQLKQITPGFVTALPNKRLKQSDSPATNATTETTTVDQFHFVKSMLHSHKPVRPGHTEKPVCASQLYNSCKMPSEVRASAGEYSS